MIPHFVVFEGLACSGKSTQAKRCAEWLKGLGIPSILNAEPTKGPLGVLIRKLIHCDEIVSADIDCAEACFDALAHEESSAMESEGAAILKKIRAGAPLSEGERQMLFVLDRLHDVRSVIRPARARGEVVMQDRYELSTFSHGIVQGIDWKALRAMQAKVLGSSYEAPSLTLFFDVSSEVALERLAARGDVAIYDAREAMEKIRTSYAEINTALARERYDPIVTIDGEKSEEEIFEVTKTHLRAALGIN